MVNMMIQNYDNVKDIRFVNNERIEIIATYPDVESVINTLNKSCRWSDRRPPGGKL